MKIARLAAVGGMLLVLPACIQIELSTSVAKSGAVKSEQSFSIAEALVKMAEGMADQQPDGENPMAELEKLSQGGDPDDIKRAKDAGLTVKVKPAKSGVGWSAKMKAKSPEATAWQGVAMGVSEEPSEDRMRFTRNGDGTVTLTMPGGSALSALGGGGGGDDEVDEAAVEAGETVGGVMGGGDGGLPEMPDLDPEQLQAMMGGLFGAMDFKMVNEVTVPGRILSATPETALTIDGATATWNFDMKQLMEFGASPEAFQVVFEPKGTMADALFQ
jgi:hypothetical protein